MSFRYTHHRFTHSGQRLSLLFACICASMSVTAQDITVPLLKQSKALQCATTEAKAKVALDGLWEIQHEDEGIPDEQLLAGQKRVLHAASLDIVLNTLIDTVGKYPALRNQVERTMLQWDYCQSFRDGVFYDLEIDESGTQRFVAADVSPLAWRGFKRLGFLGETDSRFVPELISTDQQSARQDFEHLFHRIYRMQCFPHPDTAELFDSESLNPSPKIAPETVSSHDTYPHYWETDCVYPRAAPALETTVLIVPVPVLVPPLKAELQILDVPVLVPGLRSAVEILLVPVLVPGLRSEVEILPVPVEVPALDSQLEIVPVPLAVPWLETQLEIVPVDVDIPLLNTRLEIIPVPLDVPVLATQLEIVPVPIEVTLPQTIVQIEEQALPIPTLSATVKLDPPPAPKKVFTRPVAPVAKAVTGNGGDGTYYAGGTGGVAPVVQAAPATRVVKQPVTVAQPLAQVIQQPVIAARPSYVVDSNAPLLERLLGQIGNGNILIVDKIQLTVNEYNGNVETAISSSDIGTTQNVEAVGASVVKEIVNALPDYTVSLASAPAPAVAKSPVSEVKVVKHASISTPDKQVVQAPEYYVVPSLQPMLVVGQQWQAAPKPVVISAPAKPYKKSANVPSLASKLEVKPATKSQARKQYKAPAKKAQQPKQSKPSTDGSSSLFIYKPYDWKKKSEGQSVEELLREYAEYEARHQAQRDAKKKVSSTSLAKPSQQAQKEQPAQQQKHVWVELGEAQAVTKAQTAAQPQTAVTPQTPAKSPAPASKTKQEPVEVPLTKGMGMPEEKVSFDFSGTGTQVDVNASGIGPLTLSEEAPLPYLIEEHFTPDGVAKQEKKKSAAKKEKLSLGLAGGLYLKKSLGSGNMGIGGSINRKLIEDSYWFARVGWSYSLEESDDPFSYSWGIGYSDWHPGTFSAQLNNWGPVKLGEGLALDRAVASFGYSVKSDLLKKYRLSASGSLNIPIKGNSSVAANFRWSPKENWYINASVSQPLAGGGEPKWSYGFGYSDWRPNKFNLQYSNYGPNDLFDTNYNNNGTWSFSYNWKF